MIHDLLASLSPPGVERRPSFDFLLAHTPAQTVKNNPTFFFKLKIYMILKMDMHLNYYHNFKFIYKIRLKSQP